jgi:hypothetical protein
MITLWRANMPDIRDWRATKEMYARLLEERTGENLETWNTRVRAENFADESALRAWLTERGVTGYAQALLVMERFGYPDFLLANADDLIDGQYADRPHLRPIFDTIVQAALEFGEFTVQMRKTYVSLVTSRRTFVRVQEVFAVVAVVAHRFQMPMWIDVPVACRR